MKIINLLVVLSALLLLFPSCATIVSKTNYPVEIRTTPRDASLVITNKDGRDIFEGSTPATVFLNSSAGFFKKAEYYVSITKPGYKEHKTKITSSIDGWYFGNILLGGFVGMLIVDPATGAMWKLNESLIRVTLTPSDSTDTHSLEIVSINDIPEEYRERLVKISD